MSTYLCLISFSFYFLVLARFATDRMSTREDFNLSKSAIYCLIFGSLQATSSARDWIAQLRA